MLASTLRVLGRAAVGVPSLILDVEYLGTADRDAVCVQHAAAAVVTMSVECQQTRTREFQTIAKAATLDCDLCDV